ncbi:MAG: hypothetical protein ACTSPL_00560 [Candidatus Odinarchaeia archaeon]
MSIDILKRIRDAENKAQQIIEEAEIKAKNEELVWEKKVEELGEKADTEIAEQIAKIKQEIEVEAEKEIQRINKETDKKIAELQEKVNEKIDNAVKELVDKIISYALEEV